MIELRRCQDHQYLLQHPAAPVVMFKLVSLDKILSCMVYAMKRHMLDHTWGESNTTWMRAARKLAVAVWPASG